MQDTLFDLAPPQTLWAPEDTHSKSYAWFDHCADDGRHEVSTLDELCGAFHSEIEPMPDIPRDVPDLDGLLGFLALETIAGSVIDYETFTHEGRQVVRLGAFSLERFNGRPTASLWANVRRNYAQRAKSVKLVHIAGVGWRRVSRTLALTPAPHKKWTESVRLTHISGSDWGQVFRALTSAPHGRWQGFAPNLLGVGFNDLRCDRFDPYA